ncbi:MAG: hypothetical protein V1781_02655 [Bacteroidota bacterium]
MFRYILMSVIVFAIMFFSSCRNNSSENNSDNVSLAKDSSTIDTITKTKYDKIISNIPIPFNILRSHNNAGLIFEKGAANSYKKIFLYSSSYAKAINLGIYGCDMAYCITYEQFESMGNYLKCIKTLADDLGIPLAFDQQALTKFKLFETNKDSLEKLIFLSYNRVDKTLKSNDRIGLASLVITGGWIEGLYTTLLTLGNTPCNYKTHPVYEKILEQKKYLDMILGLLNEFKEESIYRNLIADMNSIKSIYDSLSNKSKINELEIVSLFKEIEKVRNKIIVMR